MKLWFCAHRFGLTVTLLAAIGASANADYRAAVLADGPIGYWTLDEVEGGAEADAKNSGSLGNDADGIFLGDEFEGDAGPDVPGLPAGNRAMRLTRPNEDGSETPVDVASGVLVEEPILDDLSAFALTGWVNAADVESSQRSGLFGQDNAIEFGFIGASDIHFWAELPDGDSISSNSVWDFDDDTWHHLVMTGDGQEGELDLYVDGELLDFTAVSADLVLEDLGKDSYGVSGNPFWIGGAPIFGADRQFEGALDEIAVFDRYLTEDEVIAHYTAATEGGVIPCDFDGSGELDVGDINALLSAVRAGNNPPEFDITGDGSVNVADIEELIEGADKFNTYIGDSNLDGEFNSTDFVDLFTQGQYEDGVAGNSTWETGDWDGNGDFESSDFVLAFSGGGYEQGPRAAAAAVPEPAAATLLLVGLFAFVRRKR